MGGRWTPGRHSGFHGLVQQPEPTKPRNPHDEDRSARPRSSHGLARLPRGQRCRCGPLTATSPRPTRAEIERARDGTVGDVLAPGLTVVFCGINPSLYSAAVGHHFARPGNRFWPTLQRSGFTPRLLAPEEDARLLDFGLGVTNLVPRATARAGELGDQELRDGAAALGRRLRAVAPRCVAIVGVSAYRTAFGDRGAVVGPQEPTLGGVAVWVLPNPSGLNAHYTLPALVTAFGELHHHLHAAPGRGGGSVAREHVALPDPG